MSETKMIERAIRAAQAKRSEFVIYSFGAANRAPFVVRAEDEGKGLPPAFGPAPMDEIEEWIDGLAMRAAIEAIRDPSKGMLAAGYDAGDLIVPATPIWRAMIDHILSEDAQG